MMFGCVPASDHIEACDIGLARLSDSVRYTGTSFSPPTTLIADGNTVGLWTMADGSGETANDSSGNDYDAALVADSSNNNPTWGSEVIVITVAPAATNITCTTASILWTVTNTTSRTALHTVHYWLDGTDGILNPSIAAAGSDPGSGQVSVSLGSLEAGQTYDYYVRSSNVVACVTSPAGSFSQFTTKAYVIITNAPVRGVVDVDTRSTTLSWGIENNTQGSIHNTVTYRWDTATDFGYGIASVASAATQPQIFVTISNLVSGATYTFYAASTVDGYEGDAAYSCVSSGTFTVTTIELPPEPSIISISDVTTDWVMGTIAAVTWKVQKTNSEDFVSHFVIATAAGLPFTLTNAVVAEGFEDSQSNVTVLLSGLTPLQSYHYFVQSVIDSGPGHFATAANSGDFYTFTTTEAEEGGGSGSGGEPIITVTRPPTTNGVTGTAAWITWSVTTTTNCFASHHVIYRPNALPSSTNALVATGIDDGCGNVAVLLSGLTPGHNIYYYVQSVVDFGTGHFATECNAGEYYGFHVPETGADEIPPSPLMSGLRFGQSGYTVTDIAGVAVISVMRTGNTNSTNSVDYSTADGSAVAGVDYVSTSGTLSFDRGETNKTFTIQILDNPGTLADTTLNLFLSNPLGRAAIGNQGAATLTILHDGGTPPVGACVVEFGRSNSAALENAGVALINVVRTGSSVGEVSVHCATAGGSAIANEDYIPGSETLTFADGETNKTFVVTVIDNTYLNPWSRVNVALSAPAGGALLGPKSAAVLTIMDNEVPEPLPPVEIVPLPDPLPRGPTPESPSAAPVQFGVFVEVTAPDGAEKATVSWDGSASGSIQAESPGGGAVVRTDTSLTANLGDLIYCDFHIDSLAPASYSYGSYLSSYTEGTLLFCPCIGTNYYSSPAGEPVVFPGYVVICPLGVQSWAPAASVICAKPEGTNEVPTARITADDYTTTVKYDSVPEGQPLMIHPVAFVWDNETAQLVPFGQLNRDESDPTEFTFQAPEESKSDKHPYERTVFIGVPVDSPTGIPGAKQILGLQTLTVMPIFRYLYEGHNLHFYGHAGPYVMWKYGLIDNNPTTYAWLPALPSPATALSLAITRLTNDGITRETLFRIPEVLNEGENWCATIIYHEHIHRHQSDDIFFSAVTAIAEIDAYAKTIEAVSITGLDANPLKVAELELYYLRSWLELICGDNVLDEEEGWL